MEKNTAIITFNQAINFGAVLQMYALQNVLINKIGVNAKVINYISPILSRTYKKVDKITFLNPKILYNTIFNNGYIKFNIAGFKKFNEENIIFTDNVYTSKEELKELNNEFQYFITGSDQVFNPYCSGFDDNYFLNFIDRNNYKASYAASIGLQNIPEELELYYREMLTDFKNISIREKSGAKELNRIICNRISVNIDPTLLLVDKQWKKLEKPLFVPTPYILIYAISEDKKMLKFARKIAKKKKCKILYINDRLLKPYGMISLRNINPAEWLFLFRNAEAIVTNSFHGIAFSINYKKIFYPFYLNKNIKVNSRIKDLLELLKLDYLIINDIKKAKYENENIDYIYAHKILEIERQNSIQYLNSIYE